MNYISNIKEKLSEISKNNEIIQVDGGILVQMVHEMENLRSLKDKILHICVEEHKKLSSNESAFPFKIFCYKTEEEAFCVDASLDPKEREDLSFIVLDGSGLIIIREIDAEAIIFKRKTPFVLKFKDASNQFYPFNDKARYKALSFLGYSFAFEFEKDFKKIEDGKYWKVTVHQT